MAFGGLWVWAFRVWGVQRCFLILGCWDPRVTEMHLHMQENQCRTRTDDIGVRLQIAQHSDPLYGFCFFCFSRCDTGGAG